MFKKMLLLFLLLTFGVYNKTAIAQNWERVSFPAFSGPVDFVSTRDEQQKILFAGARGTLYASIDQGEKWTPLFELGSNTQLNGLYIRKNRLLLFTSRGLFESKDDGHRWQQIFRGAGDAETQVYSVAVDPENSNVIYLGTGRGLFQSKDDGKTWHKMWNELVHTPIYRLIYDTANSELFIASAKGLYRSLPKKSRFERVFASNKEMESALESDLESEVDSLDLELSIVQKGARTLALKNSTETIVLGTESGVSTSDDEGSSWETLSQSGLLSTDVLDLIYLNSQNSLIAGTAQGVFIYDPVFKRWKELESGMERANVRSLAAVHENGETLYAATDRGLYRLSFSIEIPTVQMEVPAAIHSSNLPLFRQLIQLEPSIRTIQEEAVRYANAKNSKIRSWQWASRLRALVPSVSIGKDFSKSNSIDLDRGGTNDPDKYIVGPPDTSRGWDASVDWNLSDLIWSSSQTSIDSRDKLMVELREEVLGQVTRLYFERRRAQLEFIIRPPEDPLEHLEHLLRIDELTASIDAFTDSLLSKKLTRIYSQHPELENLWAADEITNAGNPSY